jgi:hypothetical protein
MRRDRIRNRIERAERERATAFSSCFVALLAGLSLWLFLYWLCSLI